MNIIVCVKQVPDSMEDIKLTEDGKIDEGRLSPYDINEWDDYALEEALLMKENFGGFVTVITVGPERAEKTLTKCLAKGADRAIRIWDEAIEGSDSYALARILCEAIKNMEFDVILTGVQAEDDGCAQIGPTLAEMLEIHHATLVIDLKIEKDKARVHRELEGGLEEVLEVGLPAVFTIQTGINKPRYASIKGIRKAMTKEIKTMNLEDLGLTQEDVGEAGSKTKLEKLYFPRFERRAEILKGKVDQTTDTLLRILEERELI